MSATLPPSPARPVHPALRCPRGGTVGCDCDRDGKDARECFWWITYVDTSTGTPAQGDDEWDDYVDLDHDDVDYHDHNDDDSESDDSVGTADYVSGLFRDRIGFGLERCDVDEHGGLGMHQVARVRRPVRDRELALLGGLPVHGFHVRDSDGPAGHSSGLLASDPRRSRAEALRLRRVDLWRRILGVEH